jgi:chaperonin GroES
LEDRVVVIKHPDEDMTDGGIHIPAQGVEPSQKATVVAFGPGLLQKGGWRTEMPIEIGETVWIGQYAGVPFMHEGTEYTIVRKDDCLGVNADEG